MLLVCNRLPYHHRDSLQFRAWFVHYSYVLVAWRLLRLLEPLRVLDLVLIHFDSPLHMQLLETRNTDSDPLVLPG